MVKSVKKKEEGSEREKVKKDRDNKQNKAKANNINVVVRVRPFLSFEAGNRDCVEVLAKGDDGGFNTIQVDGKDKATFTFDAAYPSTSSQSDMFSSIIPLVDACLDGYNATVLAYGQTGSGKTHTILGEVQRSSDGKENEEAGVIPRALREIFSRLKDLQADAVSDPLVKNEYKVKVQFLELYGENIRDLLSEKHSNKSLAIRDGNGSSEPEVIGASEVEVFNADDALLCLTRGTLRRVTRATAMNSESSRSHAIMSVIIHQKSVEEGESSKESVTMSKTSRFHFVDLAGSERAKRTGATGQGMKEGININKGLLVLGNVISALGDPRKRGKAHVPYRDSKLTRLLKGSLGGNHRTLMIACVSPSSSNSEETTNTLRYANRAKNIKNKAEVNIDAGSKLVAELRQQIKVMAVALILCGDKTFPEESLKKFAGGSLESRLKLPDSNKSVVSQSVAAPDEESVKTIKTLRQYLDDSKVENERLVRCLEEFQRTNDELQSELGSVKEELREMHIQLPKVEDSCMNDNKSVISQLSDDDSRISNLTFNDSRISNLKFDDSRVSYLTYDTKRKIYEAKMGPSTCDFKTDQTHLHTSDLTVNSYEEHVKMMYYVRDALLKELLKKKNQIKHLESERLKINENFSQNERKPPRWVSLLLGNEIKNEDKKLNELEHEIMKQEQECKKLSKTIFEIEKENRFTIEWLDQDKSEINQNDTCVIHFENENKVHVSNVKDECFSILKRLADFTNLCGLKPRTNNPFIPYSPNMI